MKNKWNGDTTYKEEELKQKIETINKEVENE